MADEQLGGVVAPPAPPTIVAPRSANNLVLGNIAEADTSFKVGRLRENARSILACSFAVAFVGTLGGSFYGAAFGHWGHIKDWLQIVLPAETGLFGTALGFYFGSSDR